MKKTVNPSPWPAVFFGAVAFFCLASTIFCFVKGGTGIFHEILIDLVVVGVFVWLLLRYFSQEKILYDENSFTVGKKTYSYEDITNVTVETEKVVRSMPTLRMNVYAGDNKICTFTKDDKGGKDFIAVLKNNDVAVNIEV